MDNSEATTTDLGSGLSVSLTFDVDAEPAWLNQDQSYRRRLTTLSAAAFGIRRGLPRILGWLAAEGLPATFYVPGETALLYPESIASIAEGGHEVAHHGHRHLRTDQIGPAAEREEMEHGLEALVSVTGGRPSGYRSPSWELTPETLELLFEYEFAYDSSLMGDDRPYFERWHDQRIVELPVHWSLDDWPYFGWTLDEGGNAGNPADWFRVWFQEFLSAIDDDRHITYTMHPEVIGRGHRFDALRRLVDRIRRHRAMRFCTHLQAAQSMTDGAP